MNYGIEKYSSPLVGKAVQILEEEFIALAYDLRSIILALEPKIETLQTLFKKSPNDLSPLNKADINVEKALFLLSPNSLANSLSKELPPEISYLISTDTISTKLVQDASPRDAFNWMDSILHLIARKEDIDLFRTLDNVYKTYYDTDVSNKYKKLQEIKTILESYSRTDIPNVEFLFKEDGNFRLPLSGDTVNFKIISGSIPGVDRIAARYTAYTKIKIEVASAAAALAPQPNIFTSYVSEVKSYL